MRNKHWKITNPCHEPFEKMDKTARGHYCHSCKKEVLDLDDVKPGDINYKAGDDLCGRLTQKKMMVGQLSKTQLFMLRWLGAAALFFIPVKKAKTQTLTLPTAGDTTKQEKIMTRVKRIVGAVHSREGRPISSMVTLTDSTGKVIDQARSIANGKYILNIDTTIIEGDTVELTTSDSCGYTWKLDTNVVRLYPKDTLWIIGGYSEVIMSGWIAPYEESKIDWTKIVLSNVYVPKTIQEPTAVHQPGAQPVMPAKKDKNGFYLDAAKNKIPSLPTKPTEEKNEPLMAILPADVRIENKRRKRRV